MPQWKYKNSENSEFTYQTSSFTYSYLNTNIKLKLFMPMFSLCFDMEMTTTVTRSPQAFINSCLCHVIGIFWPESIRSKKIRHPTGHMPQKPSCIYLRKNCQPNRMFPKRRFNTGAKKVSWKWFQEYFRAKRQEPAIECKDTGEETDKEDICGTLDELLGPFAKVWN